MERVHMWQFSCSQLPFSQEEQAGGIPGAQTRNRSTEQEGGWAYHSNRACEADWATQDTALRVCWRPKVKGAKTAASAHSGRENSIVPRLCRLSVWMLLGHRFCVWMLLSHFCTGRGRALPRADLAVRMALGQGGKRSVRLTLWIRGV